VSRSQDSYWGGALAGNDDAKNQRAAACLHSLLESACWLNLFEGVGDGVVELRQRTPGSGGNAEPPRCRRVAAALSLIGNMRPLRARARLRGCRPCR
jgi:hypothetical protein